MSGNQTTAGTLMAGRFASLAVGLALLFASMMKGLALAGMSVTPAEVGSVWWLTLVAAGAEFFLAAWLLAGVYPATARWIALVVVHLFAAVALYKLVTGEESCGCLGNLKTPPAYILLLDVLLAACLWTTPVPRTTVAAPSGAAVFIGGALVLSAGLGMTVYQTATELGRGLFLSEATFEFGSVRQHDTLTHEFIIENRGGFPVELVETMSSCGCTTTKGVVGRVVDPGDRLAIPVTLQAGEVEEHIAGRITIFYRRAGTADLPAHLRDLLVSARVQPDYRLSTLVADFGEIDTDAPRAQRIDLIPNQEDTRIVRASVGHPAFAVTVDTGRDSRAVEVTFRGDRLWRDGPIETPVRIETDSGRRPAVTVLARAKFTAPVAVEPAAVIVGADVPGPTERPVMVRSRRPVRLTDLSGPTGVTLKLEQMSPTAFRVVVVLPPPPAGGLGGVVRFRVGDADAGSTAGRVVEVPIHRFAP